MPLFGKPKPLLTAAVQGHIVAAIQQAEAGTTGEIRVFVETKCSYVDAFDRATEIFARLKMAHTEYRNAVLLYLAITDRQFAIVGDTEIYRQAGGTHFWAAAAQQFQNDLRAGNMEIGISTCVAALGAALAANFPARPGVNKNELPDEIVFGK